ncbi:alcohol dehydrogenase catalytic domain-containing protein [Streptomyces globisporus]|uniref:alcohol dehydrogenase catalytic domain-containing protein n=1 Tax=Streptomyces globisporus TaxID=1908 RepID=UPI0004C7417D|nr:alcohol dehydrogenase catalytic domain-containing protein [Streptomyces globisporus]
MRAVLLRPPMKRPGSGPRTGRITIEDLPVPEPRPTEVLIRVEACGICGTDIDACRFQPDNTPAFGGPLSLPTVLGHEAAGVVTEVGKLVTRVQPGELVALESILSCGTCDTCMVGRRNQCENVTLTGLTAPGALADYITVPQTACHSLTPLLDLGWNHQSTVLAGALLEPLGCVYNALFNSGLNLRPGERVAVHGLGPLGLFAGLLCRLAGASRVIGVDPIAERRTFATTLGFDACLPPPDTTQQQTHSKEFTAEVHIEASGQPASTMPTIQRSLLPGSRCVIVSRADRPSALDTNPWVSAGAQLIGARGQSGGLFPYLIRLFAAGRLLPDALPDALVGATLPLTDVPQLLTQGVLLAPGKTVVLTHNSRPAPAHPPRVD